jgi:formamidopyrimidine-DNA glycosylase
MPELPDIVVLSRSLDEALRGERVSDVTVFQARCLNVSTDAFLDAVIGREIARAWQRGKWALLDLDRDWAIALNLGMGGEVCVHRAEESPDPKREKVVLRLASGKQLWAHFWWFGMVHLVRLADLSGHPQLGALGPEPLSDDFTVDRLAGILGGRRGSVKSYLLDQKVVAGIGNVYIQDMLWEARLHPLRPAGSLDRSEVEALHVALRHVLGEGIRWGGGPGEKDAFGNPGHYGEHLQVGYQTGKPCPACGTAIEAMRVGSTTSYVCPQCQPSPRPA